MAQASTMNGGDGTNSYVKNSSIQRDGLVAAKEAIRAVLIENLDVETILSSSSKFAIVDLGCSVGPNTFFAMQTIIETIEEKYKISQGREFDSQSLEFQVYFNDQTFNDFNTLFRSLPSQGNKYFAAGVPGSFFGRLFPSSSIHFAYSSSALHWLSKVPSELQVENSPAWNAGKIHYTGAPDSVVKAYANQYEKDIEIFLSARAQEIVKGGMMVIHMPGVPDDTVTHDVGIALDFLGSILMGDNLIFVPHGLLEQDKVNSFNVPHMYPSIKEMTRLVEKNGCFRIVKMELRNARPNKEVPIDIESAIMHLRALAEGTIISHLGTILMDEIFSRAIQQKNRFSHMLFSAGIEIGCQLFAVLERK